MSIEVATDLGDDPDGDMEGYDGGFTDQPETVEGQLVPFDDVPLPEPLTTTKARQLDKKIRAANGKVGDSIGVLFELLDEAMTGQIHTTLGYESWPAYLMDAVSVIPADREQRKALGTTMSGMGVSNRTIAAILGVDEKTVRRDTEGADNAAPVKHGLDGKNYPQPKQPEPEPPIDAEEVDPPEDKPAKPAKPKPAKEEPPAKPPPVSEDFKNEMGYLANSVASFKDILNDDRFPKAAKTIRKHHYNKLAEHISELTAVADVLFEATP
jgi:hypothetical protein